MEEIVWSNEWEQKLGTIEFVHPSKRQDLMMGLSKKDCEYCGSFMKVGEMVLMSMIVHPEHIFHRYKDDVIPSNFIRVELMHPMCIAKKGIRFVDKFSKYV